MQQEPAQQSSLNTQPDNEGKVDQLQSILKIIGSMPPVQREKEIKRFSSVDDSLDFDINGTVKSHNEPRPYNPQIFDTLYKMKELPTLMYNLPEISNNEAIEVIRNIEPRISSDGPAPQFVLG